MTASGKVVRELTVFLGETTNNVAEYAAFLLALQEALRLGAHDISIQTDSELLARQIGGDYRVKDPTLRVFHAIAQQAMAAFRRCVVSHIDREHNRAADRLANRAVEAGLRTRTAVRHAPTSLESPTQHTFRFGSP